MRVMRVGVALCAAVTMLLAAPAGATHKGENAEHLEGDDAVTRALAWSQYTSPDWRTREDVVLARADGFADALASGTMQGILGAPLLLTPGNVLDPRVAVELERLEAKTVHILGGEGAVSAAVEQTLTTRGYAVERYAGTTRVHTALLIADRTKDWDDHTGDRREVVIARAFGTGSGAFADALGAGALAGQWALPLLLTPTDSLDGGVADYLTEHGIDHAYLAGGRSAVGDGVERALRDLGLTTERLAGGDRAATAIAMHEPRRVSSEDRIILTEGYADDAWAAGLSATLSAVMFYEQECKEGSAVGCGTLGPDWKPIVLSQGEQLPPATRSFLEGAPADAHLICAPGVSAKVCDLAVEIIRS